MSTANRNFHDGNRFDRAHSSKPSLATVLALVGVCFAIFGCGGGGGDAVGAPIAPLPLAVTEPPATPNEEPTDSSNPPPPADPSAIPILSQDILDSLPLLPGSVSAIAPKYVGKFRNTHYYVKEEALYAGKPKNSALLRPDGTILARVNLEFKRLLDIEGSGLLMDGRVVNFAGVINGTIRYLPTAHGWGRGVGNCPLMAFRSIAVDKAQTKIQFGSVLWLPETVGMPLPEGGTHDGFWVASDTGGAIKNDRIDIFTGKESWGPILDQFGIKHLQGLKIHVVALPNSATCVLDSPQHD